MSAASQEIKEIVRVYAGLKTLPSFFSKNKTFNVMYEHNNVVIDSIFLRVAAEEQKRKIEGREAKNLIPSALQFKEMGAQFSQVQAFIYCVREKAVAAMIEERAATSIVIFSICAFSLTVSNQGRTRSTLTPRPDDYMRNGSGGTITIPGSDSCLDSCSKSNNFFSIIFARQERCMS